MPGFSNSKNSKPATGLIVLLAAIGNLVWLNVVLAPRAFDGGEATALASAGKATEAAVALTERERARRELDVGSETAAGETAAGETAAGDTAAGDTAAGETAGDLEVPPTESAAPTKREDAPALRAPSQSPSQSPSLADTELCDPAALLSRRIHFERASADLDELAVERVEAFVRQAQAQPAGFRVVIEGHADRRGDEEGNQRLAMKRADAVASRIRAVMDGATLVARSFGALRPIAAPDPQTRWRNRRVVLCLVVREEPK